MLCIIERSKLCNHKGYIHCISLFFFFFYGVICSSMPVVLVMIPIIKIFRINSCNLNCMVCFAYFPASFAFFPYQNLSNTAEQCKSALHILHITVQCKMGVCTVKLKINSKIESEIFIIQYKVTTAQCKVTMSKEVTFTMVG